MRNNEFDQLKKDLAHHYRMIAHLQRKYTAETGQAFCPAGIGEYALPKYCSGCDVYTPETSPEIEVYYKAIDPDIGPEIYNITIHGQEISESLYDHICINRELEGEIEEYLSTISIEAKEDKIIELFETKKMES